MRITLTEKYYLFLIIVVTFFSFISPSQAKFFDQNSHRIAPLYRTYSGENEKGLTQTTAAYGLDISFKSANRFMGYFAGIDVSAFSGSEKIKDGTTVKTLSLSGQALNSYLGPCIHLLPIQGNSLKPYLLGVGIISFFQVRVPDGTYTKIKSAYSGYATGYAIGGGLSWSKSTMKTTRGVFLEVKYRAMTAPMFEVNDYGLTGLEAMLGIEF